MLATTYAELGDNSQAATNIQKLIEAKPDIDQTFRAWASSLHWPGALIDKVAASLGKAGLTVSDKTTAAEPYHRDG
jgi:hypothetical protein